MTKMNDIDLEKAFYLVKNRHVQRITTDVEYRKIWLMKNAAGKTKRDGNRAPISLPKLGFMEREELFPEI